MARLVDDDVRTIGFTRSRRAAELLAEFTRRGVHDAQARARIKAYRAGYLAEDRREIERQLADGELLAVASTSALELGHRHRLAGRRGARRLSRARAPRCGSRPGAPDAATATSLAMLVAQDDPLDQYLVQHPEELFDKPRRGGGDRPDEPVRPGAPPARAPHASMPLRDEEAERFFGPGVETALDAGAERGDLRQASRGPLARPRSTSRRIATVDIRAGGGSVYRIVIGRHRRAARDRRRAPRVRDAAPRRRLPASGRAVPGAGARPRRRGSRSSSPPTPTSTRRRATSPTSSDRQPD